MLAEFAASETLPCGGVVYLWGLDAPSMDGLTLTRLKNGSEMMCRGALAILHALAETRSANPDWQAALVCDRKNAKDGKPGPAS